MIPCRFVRQFASGGTSDSLNQVYDVHAVRRVGDTLCFIGGEGPGSRSEVKEVVHLINPTERTDEIVVYYGDRKPAGNGRALAGKSERKRKAAR